MQTITYDWRIYDQKVVAAEYAQSISQTLGVPHLESDIDWALRELLGNIRHAPVPVSTITLYDTGNLKITNCAVGKWLTNEPRYGQGLIIASVLGADTHLHFEQGVLGCWKAVTNIHWNFHL